jgi:hypothetical protein
MQFHYYALHPEEGFVYVEVEDATSGSGRGRNRNRFAIRHDFVWLVGCVVQRQPPSFPAGGATWNVNGQGQQGNQAET